MSLSRRFVVSRRSARTDRAVGHALSEEVSASRSPHKHRVGPLSVNFPGHHENGTTRGPALRVLVPLLGDNAPLGKLSDASHTRCLAGECPVSPGSYFRSPHDQPLTSAKLAGRMCPGLGIRGAAGELSAGGVPYPWRGSGMTIRTAAERQPLVGEWATTRKAHCQLIVRERKKGKGREWG